MKEVKTESNKYIIFGRIDLRYEDYPNTPHPYLHTSSDTLLWDNRRILGKPIIVLTRQAQPTHD